MKRNAARRLLVIGAKLRHAHRLVVVRGNQILARFDRLAKRVSHLIRHVRVNDHGPAAEIHRVDVFVHTLKSGLRHYGPAIAHRRQALEDLPLHRQVTEASIDGRLPPAFDPFVEDGVGSSRSRWPRAGPDGSVSIPTESSLPTS